MGLYSSQKKYVGWPCTPGFEYSGEIVEISPDIERAAADRGFKLGSLVFGVTRFFAYAEYGKRKKRKEKFCNFFCLVVVPLIYVYPKPEKFSLSQIAAFPCVYLTAYYAAFVLADCKQKQTVKRTKQVCLQKFFLGIGT